jgi:nitrate/nitrite-specific signal transduction histidine kinase
MNEQLRLLAARSEHGYTDRIAEALIHEPEAVPADYQQHITRSAQADADHRRRQERAAAQAEIERFVGWLDTVAPALDANRELRASRYALVRLGRSLAPI